MTELTPSLMLTLQGYDAWQLAKALEHACRMGHLNVVDYILCSPDLVESVDFDRKNCMALRLACLNGHVDVVQYLLNSPRFCNHVDVALMNGEPFRSTCENGHLGVIQLFLSSPQYQTLFTQNVIDNGFQLACDNGHLDVVRYLLTSNDMQTHANINANNNLAYRWACGSQQRDIVHYLLTYNTLNNVIDFQKTTFDIMWAIDNTYSDIVFVMAESLFIHDMDGFNEKIHVFLNYFANNSVDDYLKFCLKFNITNSLCEKEDIVINDLFME